MLFYSHISKLDYIYSFAFYVFKRTSLILGDYSCANISRIVSLWITACYMVIRVLWGYGLQSVFAIVATLSLVGSIRP